MQDVQGSNATFRLFLWPRSTMRWILDHDPDYGVILVAMFVGITAALRSSVLHGLHPMPDFVGLHPVVDAVVAYGVGASASLPMTVVSIAMYGAVNGVLMMFLGTLGLLVFGFALGGRGSFSHVRAALAWAFVPYSWLGPIWALYGLLNWDELRSAGFSFGPQFPWEVSGTLAWLLVLDYVVRVLCLVWLTLKLSVAHDVTISRSAKIVLVTILPVLLLLVPWQGFGF